MSGFAPIIAGLALAAVAVGIGRLCAALDDPYFHESNMQ